MENKVNLSILDYDELLHLGKRVNGNGKFGCDYNRKANTNELKAAFIRENAVRRYGSEEKAEHALRALVVSILAARKLGKVSANVGDVETAKATATVTREGALSNVAGDGSAEHSYGEHADQGGTGSESDGDNGDVNSEGKQSKAKGKAQSGAQNSSAASEAQSVGMPKELQPKGGSGSESQSNAQGSQQGESDSQDNGDGSDSQSDSQQAEQSKCEACDGDGTQPASCEACGGSGSDENGDDCDSCSGSGNDYAKDAETCEACNGTGQNESQQAEQKQTQQGKQQTSDSPSMNFEFQDPSQGNPMEDMIRRIVHEEVTPFVKVVAETFGSVGEFVVAEDDAIKVGVAKVVQSLAERIAHIPTTFAPAAIPAEQARELIIQWPNVPKVSVAGKHPQFSKVLALASLPVKTPRPNIALVGPPGCGKTTLAYHIAEALSRKFYAISFSADSSRGDLFGKPTPKENGWHFEESVFTIAFRNGYVLLADELDGSSPEIVIAFNSAIANGYMFVNGEQVNMHDDFVLIAGMNTYGTGATMEFMGRAPMDGATLDRFLIVEIGPDRELNRSIMHGFGIKGGGAWSPIQRTDAEYLRDVEHMALWLDDVETRILPTLDSKRFILTRSRHKSIAMLTAGFTLEDCKQTLTAGWGDEKAQVGLRVI